MQDEAQNGEGIISVAMTTYNGEKHILEQLESIYDQTVKPDEVIIFDDGSVDATVEIIKNFISEHSLKESWHIKSNGKNIGFVENFKQAITMTKGDIVMLSDQDDVFYPMKFEYAKKFFSMHPDCDCLNTNYEFIDDKSQKMRSRYALFSTRFITKKRGFKAAIKRSYYPGFAMAISKRIRNRIIETDFAGFYGHDVLIWLMALESGGFYESAKVLNGYRVHLGQTSSVGVVEKKSRQDRIKKKEEELHELYELISVVPKFGFSSGDVYFLEGRRDFLIKRTECLKEGKVLPLLMNIINPYYGLFTVIADIASIVGQRTSE